LLGPLVLYRVYRVPGFLSSRPRYSVTLHFLRFGEIPCDTFITSFPDPRADPAQLSSLQKNELNKLPRNLKFRSLERESMPVLDCTYPSIDKKIFKIAIIMLRYIIHSYSCHLQCLIHSYSCLRNCHGTIFNPQQQLYPELSWYNI
jgi:hypothetical protein